jgi:PKD repeat protein
VFAVTNSRGRPVEGARIAFELTSAGPGADVVPDTAETDANGRAEATLVLGTTTGPQVGEARVLVPEGTREITTTFTVIALSEDADGMSAISGDDQTGPAGSPLSQPLVIQVTDAFGNPISGVPVSWTAEGGGSVSAASNVTDGDGRASVQRTLGPVAGPQSTLAESEGLAGSPVTFMHTATAGSVAGLSIESGNNQTAAAGTELPGDLVVRLVDAAGNGVPGAAVTWVVGAGGGSVAPQNTTTDEAGRASTRWRLGPNPGNNRADAVVSGVDVVHFSATGTASAPAALSIVAQPSSSAQNGVPLERQPVVQVRNAGGAPAATPGIEITAQLSGGGGALLGTRQRRTDANGRATFTDLAIAGAVGPRTLVFTASGFAGVTSNVIDVRAIGTATRITSDSPDPSIAGATVTVTFVVTSEGPTPNGSVTVTASDGGANCTGSLQNGAGSCQLVFNRTGQRTLTATYSGAPGFNPSFGTEGHRVDEASPQNEPPDADYNWHCEGLTCEFTDASDDDDGSVIAWNWNFGDGASTTQREPTHTYPREGTFTVTLTVTDDDGATDQSTATVEVEAPRPSPASTTTTITSDEPDPSVQGAPVTVRFTVTSASGTPSGEVTVIDGPDSCTGNLDASGSGSCALSMSLVGSRTIDAHYAGNASFEASSDAESHTVNEPPPPNQAPTAAFTAPSCITGQSCQFTDGSTDSDGTVVEWEWDFDDSGAKSTAQHPSHTYNSSGTYDVKLRVRDDDGAQSSEVQHAVTVTDPPNDAPTARIGSISCTGMNCTFADASTDPNGLETIERWNWIFGDGETSDLRNPSHEYANAGDYRVTLTVTDDHDATSSTERDLTVQPPGDGDGGDGDDTAPLIANRVHS